MAPVLTLVQGNTMAEYFGVTQMSGGAIVQDYFLSQDVQRSVWSLSLGTETHRMRIRPWFYCWPCLSKGLKLILKISLPKLMSVYSDYNSPFCWLCPKAPSFVLDLRVCVHDSVPPGIRVKECCCFFLSLACLEATPVQWDVILESLTSLSLAKPMPVLGLISLRPCHWCFCTHLVIG